MPQYHFIRINKLNADLICDSYQFGRFSVCGSAFFRTHGFRVTNFLTPPAFFIYATRIRSSHVTGPIPLSSHVFFCRDHLFFSVATPPVIASVALIP